MTDEDNVPTYPVKPPNRLVERVAEHVGAFAAATDIAAPHRVFVLPFEAIHNQRLSDAIFIGWRFLLLNGDIVIGSAEVPAEGEQPISVHFDPFAKSTAAVIREIEGLGHLQAAEVELRLLKVNALYLWAIWVVGDKQMLIPLEPAPSFIEAGRRYTERNFMEALAQPGVEPFHTPRDL